LDQDRYGSGGKPETETKEADQKLGLIEDRPDVLIRWAKLEGHAKECSNKNCRKPMLFGEIVIEVVDKAAWQIRAIFHRQECWMSLENEFRATERVLDYVRFPRV
jgi:hypothetical protein